MGDRYRYRYSYGIFATRHHDDDEDDGGGGGTRAIIRPPPPTPKDDEHHMELTAWHLLAIDRHPALNMALVVFQISLSLCRCCRFVLVVLPPATAVCSLDLLPPNPHNIPPPPPRHSDIQRLAVTCTSSSICCVNSVAENGRPSSVGRLLAGGGQSPAGLVPATGEGQTERVMHRTTDRHDKVVPGCAFSLSPSLHLHHHHALENQ
jgi:hypothetical protein